MDLDAILPLRTSGEYSNPGDEVTPLPEVYGNFLSPDVGAADSVDVATPLVLIDKPNLVYAANATRTASAPPVVFGNGKIQDPNMYTWNPANNYEGRGIIATVTFRLNVVTEWVMSVRHGGAVDGTGNPITNPIAGLYDLLTRRAGWTLADFDLGVSMVSLHDMDALGYPFYWCFSEPDKTIRDWLLEIMPHYHTDFTESGNGQLAFLLDRSLTTFTVQPDYHVPAYEIEDHGSPATALTFTAHADDVANQITLHGRHNWVTNDNTASYTWNYVQSQSAYGAAYPIDFTFRGMYTLAHATQWLQSFAMRHGFEPRTVSFTMRGLKGIPLIAPRFITVEWPPLGWQQHLLKIRKTNISFGGRRVSLECIDCQRELSDVIDSPLATPTQRRQQFSRLYTYVPGTVGTGGNLADAPSDPRNEAANGDFELGDDGSWDLRGRWTIVDDPALAYQGRKFAQQVPNMGVGQITTLRHRVDEGEWALVSGWFAAMAGSNGNGRIELAWYDQADQFLSTALGNLVPASTTYLESVVMAQAPATAYYYRPRIELNIYPSLGQWRCDKVFAISGSQQQVLASRAGYEVGRNLIANGNFELGNLMYTYGSGWDITNNPAFAAHGGLWYAAHNPAPVGTYRLNSLTAVPLVEGHVLTSSLYVWTPGTPDGQARQGVSWINAQGQGIGENSTGSATGVFPTWTFTTASMTAPAGAANAHMWIEIVNHVTTGLWLFDSWLITVTS